MEEVTHQDPLHDHELSNLLSTRLTQKRRVTINHNFSSHDSRCGPGSVKGSQCSEAGGVVGCDGFNIGLLRTNPDAGGEMIGLNLYKFRNYLFAFIDRIRTACVKPTT